MTLTHFIRTYDHDLDASYCHDLIRRFEEDREHHRAVVYPQHRSFVELNLTSLSHWYDVHTYLIKKVEQAVVRYMQDVGLDDRQWPEQYGFEQIRIKRYLPGTDDEFRWHVDVGDYSSARRFLVCFWYLNTVQHGGETTFSVTSATTPWYTSRAEQGKLLMFPPVWMFPHTGTKPISGPKYILGTYLHYV